MFIHHNTTIALMMFSWTAHFTRLIYIYLSCNLGLFNYPDITQDPLDRFASIVDWGTREIHGNVLSLVMRF